MIDPDMSFYWQINVGEQELRYKFESQISSLVLSNEYFGIGVVAVRFYLPNMCNGVMSSLSDRIWYFPINTLELRQAEIDSIGRSREELHILWLKNQDIPVRYINDVCYVVSRVGVDGYSDFSPFVELVLRLPDFDFSSFASELYQMLGNFWESAGCSQLFYGMRAKKDICIVQ